LMVFWGGGCEAGNDRGNERRGKHIDAGHGGAGDGQ